MPWPQTTDYMAAAQSPAASFTDPALAASAPELNMLGLPLSFCGKFAIVFKLVGPGGEAWAAKCFLQQVTDHQQRYASISRHLEQNRKRFAVEFDYQPEGMRVGGGVYPIVKMRWVEGQTLNEFVGDKCGSAGTMEQLAQLWLRLSAEMREARMAHGDLQHGNVLLVPGKRAGGMVLRLVDYDGMWVPELDGRPPGERGHANFQHPRRLADGGYGAEIDRFSHLVIYTALRALAAGGKALWARHDNGENLLFREADFLRPAESKILPELLSSHDPNVAALAGHLLLASRGPLDAVPLLAELVNGATTVPLAASQREALAALAPSLAPRAPLSSPAPDWLPTENLPAPAPGGAPRRPPSNPDLPPLPGALSPGGPLMPAQESPSLAMLQAFAAADLAPPPAPPPLPPLPPPPPPAAPPVAGPAAPPRRPPARTSLAAWLGLGLAALLLPGLGFGLGAMCLYWPRPPAGPMGQLAVPGPTTIRAGGDALVTLRLRWNGAPASGALLSVGDCPPGVTATVIGDELDGRETCYRVQVEAAPEAAGFNGHLRAELSVGGEAVARGRLPLEVVPFRARLGDIYAVTVRAGQSAEMSALVFCDGPAPRLAAGLSPLPPGTRAGEARFSPAEGVLVVPIVATRGAAAARQTVWVRLMAHGREVARGSFTLDVLPDEGAPPAPRRLTLTGPERLLLAPGKSAELELKAARGGVEGPVLVRPEALPEGLRIEPVTAAGEEVKLAVQADADAAPGPRRLKLVAYQGGVKLAEWVGEVEVSKPGAVVVIKPPRPKGPLPSHGVVFKTGDGLSLAGALWPSRTPKTALTVLIIPDPRSRGRDEAVASLAEALQKDGHSVLTFDFRGQGDNRFKAGSLPATFYACCQANATLLQALKKKYPRERGQPGLTWLPSFYVPWLVQDIIAARHWLDTAHDEETLNAANLHVIAVGEGGALAATWLLAESCRFQNLAGPARSRDVRGVTLVGVPPLTARAPWNARLALYTLLKSQRGLPPVEVLADGGGNGSGRYLAELMQGGKKAGAVSIGPALVYGSALLARPQTRQHLLASANRSAGKLREWEGRDYGQQSFAWRIGLNAYIMKAGPAPAPRLLPMTQFGFAQLGASLFGP